MTPWNAFYDLLSPQVPGCPQTTQVVALRQAAIEFCEQSLAWKYEHPDIDVVPGTAKYLFEPPGGAFVHAIAYADFNGSQLETRKMERDIGMWAVRNNIGTPEYILGGPLSLTLAPTPDVAGTLKIEAILKPTPVADGVDDIIYEEYREAVVHGALAKLMLSPKKPYTDPVLASHHMQLFQIQTACAGMREAKNHNRAPLETTLMKRR